MGIWQATTWGWLGMCGAADPSRVVRVSRTAAIQLGDGPLQPILEWQCGDRLLDTSLASLTLLQSRIEPFHAAPKPRDAAPSGGAPSFRSDEPAETLVLRLTGEAWEVEARITLFPGLDVVRLAGSVTSRRDGQLVASPRWRWAIPAGRSPEDGRAWRAYTVQGSKLEEQGSFPVTFIERFDYLWPGSERSWSAEPQRPGVRATSSNEMLPWLAVASDSGRAAFASVHWSGLWTLGAARRTGDDPDREYIALSAGLKFSRALAAGETIELPAAFAGWCDAGGLHEASSRTHRYARAAAMPPRPDERFPWVQFNSWYPWNARLYQRDMEAQLDLAARLGVEVFVLDDGWFRGWFEGGGWGEGAGWWIADEAKFPEGIRAFRDRVHARGMKFGLWIEPERVDGKVLAPSGIPPAWLAGTEANEPFQKDPSSVFQQPCFGCPGVVAWAKKQLDRLISEYGADWIKWDHNYYEVCRRSDHGHGQDDGNWAHIRGVYEVLDYVRRRYPHVVIENCASGASRLDFGLLERTRVQWLSDLPSPSYRARSQFGGAALVFPPEYLNAWVIPDSREPLTPESARFILRSAMLGAFGLSYPLPDLSPETYEIVRQEIGHYKRLRPLMAGGRFVRLLPQETSLETWGAYAYVACGRPAADPGDPCGPDTPGRSGGAGCSGALADPGNPDCPGGRLVAAILVFRGAKSPVRSLTLPWSGSPRLDLPMDAVLPGNADRSDAISYTLHFQDTGLRIHRPGRQLQDEGITVTLPSPGSCELIWVYC